MFATTVAPPTTSSPAIYVAGNAAPADVLDHVPTLVTGDRVLALDLLEGQPPTDVAARLGHRYVIIGRLAENR